LDDKPYEPEYYFALLCENGLGLYNDEACALAAESLQLEHEAYLPRGHGKGKRHGGFQPHRHFDISGSVSLQEREARLAQLKSRTECRRCGAKGHWSGDAACPKGRQRSFQTPVRLLPEQACPQRPASQVARARRHVWFTFPTVAMTREVKMAGATWPSRRSPTTLRLPQVFVFHLQRH